MDLREQNLVKFWQDQLTLGVKFREKYISSKTLKDRYTQYREGIEGCPNYLFAYIRSLIPRIYFKNPGIVVQPRKKEYKNQARVVEALCMWLIDELGIKKVIKRAILHACLSGFGVVKIGYDSEFGFVPELSIDEEGSPTQWNKEDERRRIEYNINVKSGMPWVCDVHPLDIIVPWGTTKVEDMPWICHVVVRRLEDVKADNKYKNTKDLKGGFSPEFGKMNFKGAPPNEEYCLLFEIRDLKNKRMVVISEGRVLLDIEDELQIEGLPFEFLVFNEDMESVFGISDALVLRNELNELKEIRDSISQHRRLSCLKFITSKGSLMSSEKDKLLSPVPHAVIECDGPPGSSVVTLQPNIPAELWKEEQDRIATIRELIGLSRLQVGEFASMGKTPRSAQEILAVQEAIEVRSEERRDIVADFLTNIMRKVLQVVFKFWKTPKVIKVIGSKGEEWVEFTGEEIAGEYTFKILPETLFPITKAVRYQQAMELFAMFRNDPMIDQVALRRLVLEQLSWADPTIMNLVKEPQMGMPIPVDHLINPLFSGKEGGEEGAQIPIQM